jgi:hypothetical protein
MARILSFDTVAPPWCLIMELVQLPDGLTV